MSCLSLFSESWPYASSEKTERILKRNYAKIAAVSGFLGFLAVLLGIVLSQPLDESTRYFFITIILILGVFAYFEYIKEYKTATK
jgi:putative Mn2+ efflux pump MntP